MIKIYQILAKFGKKLVEMVGKKEKHPQLNMFQVPLKQFINESHELVQLSKKTDWESLEKDLGVYYCEDNGRPGVPIRLIVGIIMLRRMFNQSDESVLDRWVENPYWQYFCGEVYFRHDYPFDRTELIKFRRRIGEKGAEQILKATVNLFEKKEVQEKEVLIDTTVQEKNITFPTDVKLQKKIIEKCRKISKREGIRLRQAYKRQKMRQRFRARAGIEPVIGHIKHDHRMLRNYLLDEIGDTMNSILAAAGFNLRKMLRRLKSEAKLAFEIFETFILSLSRYLNLLFSRKMRVFHV